MSEDSLIRSWLHRLVQRGERLFDVLRSKVRDRLATSNIQLEIIPYRTYGTQEHVEVRGRVLVYRSRRPASAEDSWLRNTSRMVRSFLTYEMADVEVTVERSGERVTGRTDEEGYFRIGLPIQGAIGWTEASVSVHRADAVAAQVLVPPSSCRYLVISDIDDTILPTGATRTATVLLTTFRGNALTRAPFPGIAEFYAALVAGAGGSEHNPIFYVSSSPWNLYSFMTGFFEAHVLPVGPVMLRDFGVDQHTFIHGRHEDHKLFEIRKILDTYPDLPCVLVGDTGQVDPEIYATVAEEYPGRVLAIYLREIGGEARQREVDALNARIDVPLISGAHTSVFAAHASGAHLIAQR